MTVQDNLVVVGIGASAGGIEALKTFFSHVPSDSGVTYVVVLHLAPAYESQLAALLEHVASIPFVQATDGVRLEANRAYVIPPGKNLVSSGSALTLWDMTDMAERRGPIDLFFRSLAQSHGARAVGVVLSGTGTDGVAGVKAIAECGGICLAQDPQEAAFNEMPRCAIDTQRIDYVLPVARMAEAIAAYRRSCSGLEENAAAEDVDEHALSEILGRVNTVTGHDVRLYKRSTVIRRIERRLAILGLGSLTAYSQLLSESADEVRALLQDLLIGVTRFFRDADAFQALALAVVPRLFENRGPDDQIRVWVTGCATGEEAYSIAMLLCEHAQQVRDAPAVQVFASDIDERAIAKARTGVYSAADVADVPAERLRRFFVPEGAGFRVSQALRETVLFAVHDVVKHAPYSRLDLISCRNLLIYFERNVQHRLAATFEFALKPGGFLFLGAAESLDDDAAFSAVDAKARLFQKGAAAEDSKRLVSWLSFPMASRLGPMHSGPVAPEQLPPLDARTPSAVHKQLLEQHAAPSILINERHEVFHVRPRAERYLTLRAGEPTRDLLELIAPELQLELQVALRASARQRKNVRTPPVLVAVGGIVEAVSVVVCPVSGENGAGEAFAILFFETAEASDAVTLAAGPATRDGADRTNRLLQDELRELQAELASMAAQHASNHVALVAANEELRSVNEELHSTLEELETSKEELQSYNQEMMTVNQELRHKIAELAQADSDSRNLMNSTDIATIFLDRVGNVKRFTPQARSLFHLIPTDVGRPLGDIQHRLRYAELGQDLEHALATLETVERDVTSEDGRSFIARVLPYRTADDHIAGTVLNFTDITALKRAEEAVQAKELQFRRAIEDAPIPIIMAAEDGEILHLSRRWREITGYTSDEVRTLSAWLSRACGDAVEARAAVQEPFAIDGPPTNRTLVITTATAEARHWHFSAAVPGHLADGRRFLVGMAVDVTERHKLEESERRQAAELRGELLRELVRAQETERRRISQELHDHLGQQLTALRLQLNSLKGLATENGSERATIETVESMVSALDADIDFLVWQLRPAALEELGLIAALSDYLADWSRRTGVQARLHCPSGTGQASGVSGEIETVLYRLAQEALNNIAKHARARNVNLVLDQSADGISLLIEDDGVGFDVGSVSQAGGGLGLQGMRERVTLAGGTVDIESGENGGASVFVRLPNPP